MLLKILKAENFKNYEKSALTFGPGLNCFVGLNGAGKTNMLDAIFYLCNGKSYFNPVDKQLIKEGTSYFSLKGEFERQEESLEILCVLMEGRKKVIKHNGETYPRLADHYGEYPAVVVAPADVNIIMGGSEERRRWLDSVISLHDRLYLNQLLQYDKVLQQRNAQLKKMSQQQLRDKALLDIYDQMLVPLAENIYERRRVFLDEFISYFTAYHRQMAEGHEEVAIRYDSSLHKGELAAQLEKNFNKDLALQRTTKGAHRDDLEFMIGDNALKRYGSQGQQKTFLLALKLAQYAYIEQKKGFAPLLLLDDVCERLDEERLQLLFRLIREGNFGQVFITDSSEERIKKLIAGEENTRLFQVNTGQIEERGTIGI